MPMTCITTLLHLWALFGGTQDKNNRLPVVLTSQIVKKWTAGFKFEFDAE